MVISLQSIQVLKTNFIYEKDTFYSVLVFSTLHMSAYDFLRPVKDSIPNGYNFGFTPLSIISIRRSKLQ